MYQSDTATGDLWNSRFEKGVEMLASEHQAVRLGGVYSLWHLFDDSSKPHRIQLIETLCAFVRQPPGDENSSFGLREDVQAVMDVFSLDGGGEEPTLAELSEFIPSAFKIGVDLSNQNIVAGKVPFKPEPEVEYPLKLRSANLDGGRLFNTNLAFSTLRDASLRGVALWGTDLYGAVLRGASLSSPYVVEGHKRPMIMGEYSRGTTDVTIIRNSRLCKANMIGTQLVGTWFYDSDLSSAVLWNANLSRSTILQTDFSNAILIDASLEDAELEGVNFTGANLQGTKLSGINFSGNPRSAIGLTQSQLNQATADPANPPVIDGLNDAETGKPLTWNGGLSRK